MYFTLHNKLTIKHSNITNVFYNKILASTLIQLSTFDKYNQFLSIGNGQADELTQNAFHLSNHQKTIPLQQTSFQSDISKGEVFAKYIFKCQKSDLDCDYITEIALSNNESNPIIFNYFSLIDDVNPNGLNITNEDEIVFEITIFSTINETNPFILTSGNNPFIEFLLGNGIGDVYSFFGSNYSESERITREINPNRTLLPCNKSSSIENNSLTLNFSISPQSSEGDIDEIIFITENRSFARQNLKNYNSSTTIESTLTPHANYVIKLEDDVVNINSITNQNSETIEENYYISKYANSFGDQIHLPFDNLFNSETNRFVSKDGGLLFFVLNDNVFAYKNENFTLAKLNTKNVFENYITNIISFDRYVFIISKIKPYIFTYIIEDNSLVKVNNNISEFEKFSEIEEMIQLDITICNNGQFLIGILTSNKTALTIYLDYTQTLGFTVNNYLTNSREFNYILAMYKNNFCDGRIIYLKEGETSASSRIVTHYSDATENDVYSYFAYDLTNNSNRIYIKNRAIISEKSTSPSVVIYYYPQIYKYELPLISTEIKNYISHDMNYIIQEYSDHIFKTYNLVGYDTPEEFITELSSIASCDKIQDLEFMKDSILIFQNDSDNPIIAFNLKLNKTQIENLSDNTSSYLINYNKYNKLNSLNQNINFNFSTGINL